MKTLKTFEVIVYLYFVEKCSFRIKAIDYAWAWELSQSMISELRKNYVKKDDKFPITTEIKEVQNEIIKIKAEISGTAEQ